MVLQDGDRKKPLEMGGLCKRSLRVIWQTTHFHWLTPLWMSLCRLMLGFMNSCAFLSMWVQNTSAVAMVMPIVEAIIQQILNAEGEGEQRQRTMTGTSNLGLELEGENAQ